MIIYNDYKKDDWLKHQGGLPTATIIMLNNIEPDSKLTEHLFNLGYTPLYVDKLQEAVPGGYDALDAENYSGKIKYSYELGQKYRTDFLFPENLGGDKYKNYDDFIEGVDPEFVILERTYSCWWPWDLKRFWDRNQYLRDRGIETFIGIWLDSIPWPLRSLQYNYAKKISGGNIFWYSEKKELPKKGGE